METSRERLWALVLAGGDGTRLQPLTRLIAGAPIPKQYCRILGSRSLLDEMVSWIAGGVFNSPANSQAVGWLLDCWASD